MTPPRTVRSPSGHYTPLRYPGGKGKIATFIDAVIESSDLSNGVYVEPYAGGAAVAMELLLKERVRRVVLNDVSRNVYAFWHSVLRHTDDLCALIEETPLTLASWDIQKSILRAGSTDLLDLGFATFFLNRTNRSGILNAGVIGGRAQTGAWLIDARYNAPELTRRVREIAKKAARISLFNLDAVDFLEEGRQTWASDTLIYLDPPYFLKGRELYYDHYDADDHLQVRQAVARLEAQRWLVSYDDVPQVASLYHGERWLRYSVGYSARTYGRGSEIMFFGPRVAMPGVSGSMRETERVDYLRNDQLAAWNTV